MFCSEGNPDAPLRQLTPIAEMSWLLTDTQLAELHHKFPMGENRSLYKIADIARLLNIRLEIVYNWLEHMRNTYVLEWDSRKSQCSCES